MKQIGIAGIWVVAAAALAAGCNDRARTIDVSSGAPRQVRPITELVAREPPWIPDMPVPIGFNLDQGKSRDYTLSGARFVDHTYKGGAEKLAVRRFYERWMPINRWTLTTAMFVRGEVILDFEKETERCRVIITNGSIFHRTCIKVQLWTSGPVVTPSQG